MTTILAFFQTPVGQLVLLAIGYGARELIAFQLKSKRFAALAGVEQAAADVVQSGLAAKDPQAARDAAKAALIRDIPEAFSSLQASVDVLLDGHIAQKTREVTTPGGSTVTLPTLGAP
jgi:hypothetical protein